MLHDVTRGVLQAGQGLLEVGHSIANNLVHLKKVGNEDDKILHAMY